MSDATGKLLPPADLAALLNKTPFGQSLSDIATKISADVSTGAPANITGEIDLIKYAAWLYEKISN